MTTEHDHSESTARPADLSHAAHLVAEAGQEAGSRVANYVRDWVDQTARYAQDVSGRASERIADVAGRPPKQWVRQLRQSVGESPLKALAMAIAAGYVVGRVARRG